MKGHGYGCLPCPDRLTNFQALATADALAEERRVATEKERERCLGKVRKQLAQWNYALCAPAAIKAVRQACREIMLDIESGQ